MVNGGFSGWRKPIKVALFTQHRRMPFPEFESSLDFGCMNRSRCPTVSPVLSPFSNVPCAVTSCHLRPPTEVDALLKLGACDKAACALDPFIFDKTPVHVRGVGSGAASRATPQRASLSPILPGSRDRTVDRAYEKALSPPRPHSGSRSAVATISCTGGRT